MPRVQIPGVGIVQFPDNMSREDIMSQAEAMQKQAQQPLLDPRELPTTEIIKGGFSRGIESLKGTALDLVPALAGSIFGKEDYAKQQLQEYRDRMAAIEETAPTAYRSYKDIGSIGQAFDFAAETFGEVGADVASFLVGAGAGSVAGKQIAKKALEKQIREQAAETAAKRGLDDVAKKDLADRLMSRAKAGAVGVKAAETGANVGLKTGLWGTSMGVNVPDVLNSVYEDTGELAPGIALTIGSLVAALDTYLPQKILSQLSPSAKERIAAQMLQKSDVVPTTWKKAFAAEALKTAGGESLTEGTQEILTKLGSQIAGDKDPFFSQENIDQILTASLKGFIGGGTYGAPGAAVEAKRIKDERNAQIARNEFKAQEAEAAKQVLGAAPAPEPLTPEQEAAKRREERQFAARQQIYGDLFGEPVPAGTRGAPTFPVGQEVLQPEATLPTARGELDLRSEPVQGELALEEPTQPAPTPEFPTVLTPEVLKDTGLKPNSGFYKKLLNKDITNPEDQAVVRDTLVQIRQNRNLADSTKEATERIAMQAFGALSQQQEMFGPRGGVLKGADYGRVQPGPVGGVSGAGVPVPSGREGEGAAAGVTTPEERGLAPAAAATDVVADREELQPSALTPEEQDALQQELAAEVEGAPEAVSEAPAVGAIQGVPEGVSPAVTAPAVAPTPAETVASKAAAKAPKAIKTKEGNLEFQDLGRPSETNFTDFIGRGYLGFASQDIENIDDSIKIADVVQGKLRANPMTNAAKIYFSKMPRTIDNLINISFDLAFNTPNFRQDPDDTTAADEVEFFRGMNGKNARFAHTWVLQNLSPETQKKMREFIRGFEIARDNFNDKQLMDLIREGLSGVREEYKDETVKSYITALEEEMATARNRAERRAVTGKNRKFAESLDSEVAGYTPERLEKIIDKYSYWKPSESNLTKAYIGYVSPQDFLNAATPIEAVARIEKESRPLDQEQLAKYSQEIQLYLDENLNLRGHEGRHRMVALRNAGIQQVPVVFVVDASGSGYGTGKIRPELTNIFIPPQDSIDLGKGQKGFTVDRLIPISGDNEARIKAIFGQAKSPSQILFKNPVAQLAMPLHPAIAARLVAGDLVGALRMLSANPNNLIARAASRLAISARR